MNLLFVGPGGNDPANAFLEWVGQSVCSAVAADSGVKSLWGETRGAVDSALQTNPDVLYFGHGDRDSLGGDPPLIDIGNIGDARDRVVMALACSSAGGLGVEAVTPGTGVNAYLGWTRPVVVPAGRYHPPSALFPWIVPGQVLVTGRPAEEAVERFREALEEEADRVLAEKRPDWTTAVAHANQLIGIAYGFVCRGNNCGTVTIKA